MKRTQFKRKLTKPMKAKQTGSARIDLKRKAWGIFSQWIRARDKRCVTCGSTVRLHAGHFWHNCLDFDEMNVNAQCNICNTYLSGNLAPYSVYLIRKYGREAFEDLEKRHWLALSGEYKTDTEYLAIIDKYKLDDEYEAGGTKAGGFK